MPKAALESVQSKEPTPFLSVRFADIRRVNLPVFKHDMFYFIADDAVVVLGILHGHRDSIAELPC